MFVIAIGVIQDIAIGATLGVAIVALCDLANACWRPFADKALEIAGKMPGRDLDFHFLEQAAMLHDIGIFLTDSPVLGCYGQHPYLCHGILGRRLLEKIGLPQHALVCERHVGVGISRHNVLDHKLPLPARDMLPPTLAPKLTNQVPFQTPLSKLAPNLFSLTNQVRFRPT